jgi:hypothetical protein
MCSNRAEQSAHRWNSEDWQCHVEDSIQSGDFEVSDIKQDICNAVWSGEIDQISTREVADKFDCTLATARRILLDIVKGKSGDERFVIDEDRGSGVIIENEGTFDYSPMDLDGSGITISRKTPKHYIWFVS